MILFACSACQKELSVKEPLAGKQVKCPGCAHLLTVPAATAVAVALRREEPPTLPPAHVADAPTLEVQPATPPPRSDLDATQTLAGADADTNASLIDFLAPAQAPEELGRLGKYRILQILGHGGMGVVYRAEDLKLQRLVALKAMLPGLAASAKCGKRFLLEAQAMAKLEHDHIVRIYQVDEERGVPFLAMEFLRGEALDARLRREPKLPPAEVLRIGRQIAEGLAAAHAHGLIHRDIKPGNIWLENKAAGSAACGFALADNNQDLCLLSASAKPQAAQPRVKILDFGLARAASQDAGLTQQGAIVGTPTYMSPEQGRGDAVDARSDLFSLGIVLYLLASGRLPFEGSDTVSTLVAIATRQPVPPIQLNGAVPPALSELIMQLLAKEPEERPASAEVVARTLHALERGEASGPERQRRALLAKRPLAGARALTLALVLGSMALLAAIIVLYWPTPNGTVRIEINDPDITVTFDKNGPVFKGADKHEIKFAPGEHGLRVQRGDLAFETDKFILKKGDTVTLKVEWFKDGKLQVVQGDNVLGEKMDRRADAAPLAGSPPFVNSLGMKLARVPRGESWLGGGGGQPGDRKIAIAQDFYLGVYEVTQEEWQAVMGENPSYFSRQGEGADQVKDLPEADLKKFPVEHVSWDDAQDFLNRLNARTKKPGWVYRLPTSTEWEYACRGGPLTDKARSGFNFYLDKPGNQLQPGQANFEHDDALKRPCKVGSYQPNALGLFDMHGNVWEWCDDAEKTAEGAVQRRFHGGSWQDGPAVLRAKIRNSFPASARHGNFGIRVACVPARQPLDEAWFQKVTALPADQQLAAVKAMLIERNPGFDGALTPTIEDDVVTELRFLSQHVTDLSPVRALTKLRKLGCNGEGADNKGRLADLAPLQGMQLTELACFNSQVTDLTPLKGMPLTFFDCGYTHVADLAPLKGMKLTILLTSFTKVADLAPVEGMPLKVLHMAGTRVAKLEPLKDMPLTELVCFDTRVEDLQAIRSLKLTELNFSRTKVKDLEPLKDMPLANLWLDGSQVEDLKPLQGMKLKLLWCQETPVKDLTPLKGMPLQEIFCDFKAGRDEPILNGLTTLETINGKEKKQFWKEANEKK